MRTIQHRCSQYLGVKYFREKALQVLRVLAVFGLDVPRDTASTRCISRFCTTDTAILSVCRGSIVWNTAVLQVCHGSVLRVLPSTRSIPSVGTASAARTRSTYETTLSMRSVLELLSILRPCVCSVSIFSSPLYCRKHSRMATPVGVGETIFRGGNWST